MKKSNDTNCQNDLIEFHFERAYQTLDDAAYNLHDKRFHTAANRLYYACYYAANAVFISKGIEIHTHAGVKTQINKFCHDGLIDRACALTFNQLIDLRHSSDYSAFFFCDPEIVKDLYPAAKTFIDIMHSLIKKNSNITQQWK